MAATSADIATFTTNGIVVTSPLDPAVSQAIKGDNIDALSGADREIEMFYDLAGDAQTALDERFSYLSIINPVHLGIEVEEAIDLGGAIPLTPAVPRFRVIDEPNGLDAITRIRAYAHDMSTDRFSVEVIS